MLFAIALVSAVSAAPINVHVVCHTHDDVGWLKTVDEYFMGANNSIQHAGVQYILDAVVPALEQNPERKFIYVEIAFFYRWWQEQSDSMQARVKKLVRDGQLEFINGGWCMNDESGTSHVDIIDQMTLGLRFLRETFDVVPSIGWHIDPFGHSSTQAALFGQMGFNGFFFARIDYDDYERRRHAAELEFVWRSSPSAPESAIFTGVLFGGYGPPDGFCFDQDCADPPIQDDPRLEDYNVEERAEKFAAACAHQNTNFTSGNIMLTMGSDFEYENANAWYKNLDKLMHHLQANVAKYNLNVFYSTPSRYVAAVHSKGLSYSVKTDDFFPYADVPAGYWTGYMTSRPALKGYVRRNSAYLQTCRQVDLLTDGKRSSLATSEKLTQSMGVAQHHDAVAGTEKQHVALDYAKRISIGHDMCAELINDGVSVMVSGTSQIQFAQCDQMNVTVCPATQSGARLAIVVWNSRAQEASSYVRLPINNTRLQVLSSSGTPVMSNIVPVERLLGRPDAAGNVLVFKASAPALGYNTYFLVPAATERKPLPVEPAEALDAASVVMENAHIRLTFDQVTGRTASILHKQSGKVVKFDQMIAFYNSSAGNTKVNSSQPGGAYIFRPNRTDTFPVTPGSNYTARLSMITNGTVVQEARQSFGDWGSQVIRLYGDAQHLEFEYTIGPISIKDGMGKEVITQYFTDLDSAGTWMTDANGREMIPRRRNYRATWKLNCTAPVSCDYAPVNNAITLSDAARGLSLTVVTDRSEGGASTRDGELELLLHRRLLHDDYRGVGEPLNETGITGEGLIIRVNHKVFIGPTEGAIERQRSLMKQAFHPLLPMFAPLGAASPQQWAATNQVTDTFVGQALPDNVDLLTLQPIKDKSAILRLAHTYAVGESASMSVPATVDLGALMYRGKRIVDATELSLGANQDLSEMHRLSWNTKDGVEFAEHHEALAPGDLVVTLKPLQIRTFHVHFA